MNFTLIDRNRNELTKFHFSLFSFFYKTGQQHQHFLIVFYFWVLQLCQHTLHFICGFSVYRTFWLTWKTITKNDAQLNFRYIFWMFRVDAQWLLASRLQKTSDFGGWLDTDWNDQQTNDRLHFIYDFYSHRFPTSGVAAYHRILSCVFLCSSFPLFCSLFQRLFSGDAVSLRGVQRDIV